VQTTGSSPVQPPNSHVSVWVQALPSLHVVPFGFAKSNGQVALAPEQVSA
jgi:hypothetical protein